MTSARRLQALHTAAADITVWDSAACSNIAGKVLTGLIRCSTLVVSHAFSKCRFCSSNLSHHYIKQLSSSVCLQGMRTRTLRRFSSSSTASPLQPKLPKTPQGSSRACGARTMAPRAVWTCMCTQKPCHHARQLQQCIQYRLEGGVQPACVQVAMDTDS